MKRYLKCSKSVTKWLSKSDPVMSKIIGLCGVTSIELNVNNFESLVNNIIGQQLSNKVAVVLRKRVLDLCGEITPNPILEKDDTLYRDLGISSSKTQYIKNLSVAVVNNQIDFDKMEYMSDEEIVQTLTKIKGIGQWTAEMFLIFSLGRENVFSFSDGGLKRVISIAYFKSEPITKVQVERIVYKWNPYKSYASLYLWELINRDLLGDFKDV